MIKLYEVVILIGWTHKKSVYLFLQWKWQQAMITLQLIVVFNKKLQKIKHSVQGIQPNEFIVFRFNFQKWIEYKIDFDGTSIIELSEGDNLANNDGF